MGLSLAYALPITDRLNGLLTVSAESEQEMVAVERLTEYTHLPCQPSTLHPHRAVPEQELALPFQSKAAAPMHFGFMHDAFSIVAYSWLPYVSGSALHVIAAWVNLSEVCWCMYTTSRHQA